MAILGALAVMRCLGKKSISVAEGPAIQLTRVRFTNEYAMRNYTINTGTDIEYDCNEDFSQDAPDYSEVINYENVVNINDCENIPTRSESIFNGSEIATYSAIAETNSSNTTAAADNMTSQNGVVLISIRNYGNVLPEAEDIDTHSNVNRQFSQTVDVVPARTTRAINTRSYDIIQSREDPDDVVISMRLARSALSEELMTRQPPSYDRIVDLTDGAYIKPLPPSYDSIFQTNKL